ncbi:MAG: RNA polymerase sigma factor [Bacteroidota bacterium]
MEETEFLKSVKKHSGIIHKVIYLYVEDAQDKKDLYQEILFQAWKSIHGFKGQSTFSTWLYRVSLNTVLTFKRKETKRKEIYELSEIHEEEVLVENENSTKLLRAIKELEDINKVLITLHLEDYSNSEIAHITGITKNNVAVKLHRIKESLAKKLNRKN